MLGQGITPEQHHPVADLMRPEELRRFLEDIRVRAQRIAASLPPHLDYVQPLCAPFRGAA